MEILILGVVVVAIVGAIVLLAWPQKPAAIRTVHVQGTVPEVINDLQLALAGIKHTTVQRASADSLIIIRDQVAGWAIVVAIVLFPIGLVALVARKTTTGTIVAEPGVGDTTVVRLGGRYDPRAIRMIDAVIGAAALPSPAVAYPQAPPQTARPTTPPAFPATPPAAAPLQISLDDED